MIINQNALRFIAIGLYLSILIFMIAGCYSAPKPKQDSQTTQPDEFMELLGVENTKTTTGCEEAKTMYAAAIKLSSLKKRIEELERVVVLCPDKATLRFRLAMELEKEQDTKKKPDYSQAEAEYREVLRIDPSYKKAFYQLAGIEYVTGRFDSAVVHYQKFLELDKDNEKNQDMHLAAERLIIKCSWLSTLPPNSIDLKALRMDPDRYSGMATLVGDIALELGKAATDITGKIGYQAAGTGIWLGAGLLGGPRIENFDWFEKALKKKNYPKLYAKSLKELPKAVNKKGVNSQSVSILVMGVFLGGRELQEKPEPQEFMLFVRAVIHDIQSKSSQNGYERYFDLVYKSMALALAYETLGDEVAKEKPGVASIYYKQASKFLNRFYLLHYESAHVYVSGTNKMLTYSAVQQTDLMIRYKAAMADSKNPKFETESLQSLIDVYKKVFDYPDDWRQKVGSGFLLWSANMYRSRNRSIEALQAYNDFIQSIQLSQDSGPDVFSILLGWTLVLDYWGKYDQAVATIKRLKTVSPNFQGVPVGDKISALVYKNVEQKQFTK